LPVLRSVSVLLPQNPKTPQSLVIFSLDIFLALLVGAKVLCLLDVALGFGQRGEGGLSGDLVEQVLLALPFYLLEGFDDVDWPGLAELVDGGETLLVDGSGFLHAQVSYLDKFFEFLFDLKGDPVAVEGEEVPEVLPLQLFCELDDLGGEDLALLLEVVDVAGLELVEVEDVVEWGVGDEVFEEEGGEEADVPEQSEDALVIVFDLYFVGEDLVDFVLLLPMRTMKCSSMPMSSQTSSWVWLKFLRMRWNLFQLTLNQKETGVSRYSRCKSSASTSFLFAFCMSWNTRMPSSGDI